MGNLPRPDGGITVLLAMGIALLAGVVVLSACVKRASKIDLVEVEALPDICLPVPRGFRRTEGYGIVPRVDSVSFSNWRMRYPEHVGVIRVEGESEATELVRSQIEMHCNCDWQGEVPRLNDSPQVVRFRDHYADAGAKIIASLKTIDGREYLVLAYCLTVRDYCTSFLGTVPELLPCSEVGQYLSASESIIIPTTVETSTREPDVVRKKPIRRDGDSAGGRGVTSELSAEDQ